MSTNELLAQKSQDAETTPGFGASFSPDEAELAGAFVEDALSENDVLDTEELIDEHN
nr:conjugal transfer protein TraD [Shewanella sairae]